ncbi:membrane-bound lytic murein transglycosylase MltF [Mangrovitalea sediminis]|uniref:membrane-bound lytic murein transglycosylase MltF n=1 Tax=Mangrovitalea sediminis TaxID=1982043 RepID=UPI001D0D23AC|nr:membrane-bound lytic murein transglycosylase MltF [Mangrovitalea sediminis]
MLAGCLLSACSPPSTLERIHQEKVLHIITRNAPSVYYEGRDGPAGFEYELAKRFADDLGVRLQVRVADNRSEIFSVLNKGYASFAAAGLAITPERAKRYKLSPVYLHAHPMIVYRDGTPRPDKPEDLVGRSIMVIANSSHVADLKALQKRYPGIRWEAHKDMDTVDLLQAVNDGKTDLAVVDSNELDINQAFFPKVRKGFQFAREDSFAWFFPASEDNSLVDKAKAFFKKIEADGTLAQLRERYYGHQNRLSYVGARTFVYHVRNRLPNYEDVFREAASTYKLDWRLLAAIGYQESHWRPNAVSPTGVRGLMMLTLDTAQDLGINNRLNPEASILGGAKYFSQILQQIPDHIPEPDRTWFALASYNVGYGHVEDARILAQAAGKDPDKWADVKDYLPLLAQKKWYSRTKHGYARGQEAVVYVQNIRRYFDVLAWMNQPASNGEVVASQTELKQGGTPDKQHAMADVKLPAGLQLTPPTL